MAADETSGPRPQPVVLRIKLRYDDVDAMVQRFAANVGKSGVFLPTKSIQPIGTELKFELRLADDKVVIVGLGRVKAARAPDPAEPKAAFGMAVELMRVTRESRELILRMLERRRQLGLGDIGMPMPEDVDAARRADVDTSVREPIPAPITGETASGEASVFTAPRRASGPIAVAKEYPVQPLAPEPAKRPRPRISELIAQTRSGPVTAVSVDELDDSVDVGRVLARARALTSGDVDNELAKILDQAAAPVEIGIEAASAELARQLGGKPVARRERSQPGARWAPPPSVELRDAASEGVVVRAPIDDKPAEALAPAEPPAVVEAPPHVEPVAHVVEVPAHVEPVVATVEVEPVVAKVVEVPEHVDPVAGEVPEHVEPVIAKVVEVPEHVEPAASETPAVPPDDATIDLDAHLAADESPSGTIDLDAHLDHEANISLDAPAAKPRLPTLPEDSVDLALDAIVSNSDAPKRPTPVPSRRKSTPVPRLQSEPRLLAGAELEVDEALSALRASTGDIELPHMEATPEPAPPPVAPSTDPFPRVEDAERYHDAVTEDGASSEPVTERGALGVTDHLVTERGEPQRKGTLDRLVDELEFEGDSTSVGAMVPDPHAFDNHAFATEPAAHEHMADRDEQPADDEEFEIEEISDFEIIAEADAEDADLLAADGERDAGEVMPDEASDYAIPYRPSQDFASRLDLDDDDDGHVEHIPHHDFDRSDVHVIEPHLADEESAISYIGENPEHAPYDPLSHSYTETTDTPDAGDSLEFDAPHQFARKRSHDHELESALKDLEPDLDVLAPPYAGASEEVRQRVSTGKNRAVASRTESGMGPPSRATATPSKPSEPAGRQHPRAGTEDGILIDFDEDE